MEQFRINLFLLMVLFNGCTTFRTDLNYPAALKVDAGRINGEYEITFRSADSLPFIAYSERTLIQELNRKLLKYIPADTENVKLRLMLLDENNLRFSYLKNGSEFRSQTLKYKMKSDGYLYLKNKNIKTILIPYFLGALDIKKTRFSSNAEGDLVMDVIHHRSGAIGLIIFLDFNTWRYQKVLKKIR